jgi:hypothetical protein
MNDTQTTWERIEQAELERQAASGREDPKTLIMRVTAVEPSSIVQSIAPSTVETRKRRGSSQSSEIGPTCTRSTEAPK